MLVIFHLFIYYLRKNKKYDKIWKIKNIAIVFSITIVISSFFTITKNQLIKNNNEKLKQSNQYSGVIVSNPIEKEYGMQYVLKINRIGDKPVDIKYVYLMVREKGELKYGNEISFKGEYKEPDGARNDKGFDYKQHLKSNRNGWKYNNIRSKNNF